MTSLRFDLGPTLKTLNFSSYQFCEQSGLKTTIHSSLHLVSKFHALHFVIENDSKVYIDAIKALTSNVP